MKTITIAIKDTLTTFRDRNAILLMIAAPLLISAVMGLAFGGQGQGASPISEIPLIVVNTDAGELGEQFAEVLAEIEVDTADGVKPLFAVTEMDDKDAAIAQVELGETRGAVYIPADFSQRLKGSFDAEDEAAARETVVVEVYTDPAASVSPGIIRGVVGRIASGFSTAVIGNIVAVELLLAQATDIPVFYVNDDEGPVSAGADAAFSPENFEGLFVLTAVDDLETAEARLAAGEAEAVIHIRPGFSEAVTTGGDVSEQIVVTGAEGSLSAPIVADIAASVATGFGSGTPAENAPEPVVLANLDNLEAILRAENETFGESQSAERIVVDTGLVGESEDINLLNYFVPSMSIFFLMFAVFDGTRSILEEERDGTLHRLMTTPTSRIAIILGKIGGAFLSGILQFVILVLVSGLVFGVDWGSAPVAMSLVVLGTVAAATSLGAFVASFARNNNQANVLGTAITLVFAILGGNFVDYRAIPDWLTPFSRLTINRWAMEGFVNLTLGGQGLADVMLHILVLFGMAVVLFGLAVVLFNRRFIR